MSRTLRIMLICLFATTGIQAQSGWKYRSFNYGGILLGDKANGPLLQSIHGVYHGRQYFGAGVGLDLYRRSSVPLFAAYRLRILPQKDFYAGVNAGTHFLLGESQYIPFGTTETTSRQKLFGEAGVDWFVTKPASRWGVSLGAWFSYKRFGEKFNMITECLTPPCNDVWDEYRYNYYRWALKAGFVF